MRLIFLFLAGVISNILYAQKEATHWFFGSQAGLYFDQAGPTPVKGSAMRTQDGCAVISDKETGALLFYSNGRNVWNREHQLMSNGQDFPVDCWSGITQSALIVPFPGNSLKYYLFSIYYTTTLGGSIFIELNCMYGHYTTAMYRELRYSVIDMSLNNGLGDVLADQKHVPLQQDVTEKLAAVPHSNGRDYWVITHAFNSNEFYAYLLTEDGIAAPVITAIGSTHALLPDHFHPDEETRGEMKASPDGTRLACAVGFMLRPFDLFDFNPTTGQLTNYINLGLVQGQSGLSFSPDNSKLYVTTDGRPEPTVYPYPDLIIQYDLAAGDEQAVIASRKSIFRDNPFTNVPEDGIEGFFGVAKGMQLAPDGRLYATGDHAYSSSAGQLMVVIEKPNEPGVNCMVNYKKYDFGSGRVGRGLPNFIQSYFNGIESGSTCGEEAALSVFPNPTTGIINLEMLTGCSSDASIVVFNALGQRIASFTSDTHQSELDISNWPCGIYFFVLTTAHTQKVVKRVVKI
ncbi:MAG: T9SS type A sorting domain-containing protein [Cyclobacteriaceae bacterium]|nr:T9SS type A sorting domain-containing protein [Cyclobacteriaceae bacterium]